VEDQEREAAYRRLKVYKELANAHIRQVLDSMLTLKVVDET